MISCQNCGGLNQEGATVCGACGASLVTNPAVSNPDVNQL